MGLARTAPIRLNDSVEIRLGNPDAGDVAMQWNATYLQSGPATGMWANCPSTVNPDPNVCSVFYDDFHYVSIGAGFDVAAVWNLDTGTTGGTAILGNVIDANTPGNGFIQCLAQTTDNDFIFVNLHEVNTGGAWLFAASGLRTWFEIGFITGSVTDCSIYVGMFSETVIKPFNDNDGAETVQDGIYFRTLTATPTEVDFCVNQNTTETEVQGNGVTLAADTAIRVGFFTDGTTLTPYFNGTAGTTSLASATNYPTDEGLSPGFGILTGSTATKTLYVDYVKVVQMRA